MYDKPGAVSPACQRSNSRQYQFPAGAAGSILNQLPYQDMEQQQLFAASSGSTCGEAAPWAHCRGEVAWWFVEIHALEVIRTNPAPGSPLPPLSVDAIRRTGRRCTRLKARFTLGDFTKFSALRVIDIGLGSTFTWYGPNIVAGVQGPRGLVPAGNGITNARVGDVLVEVSAAPIPWSTGKTGRGSLVYTDSFSTAAPSPIVRPIPPGARSLTVYQTAGAAVAVTFLADGGTLIGNANGVGIPTATPIPTNACDVSIIPPAAAPVGISLVWTLDV